MEHLKNTASENTPVPSFEGPSCPIPLSHGGQIVIGHGSGGRMTQELVERVFKTYLSSEPLNAGNDFALLNLEDIHITVSTDSHIVKPLFFPGGDIGRLAVCGTVNDIAVSGAIPLYLTAGFILEEGLKVETLQQVLTSMQLAAQEAGVQFISGDTKVVEKGKGDGLFINTTGIGILPRGRSIHGANARPGDVILVSGTLGDHGIAVLSARGELGFETNVQSDVAPLNGLISDLLEKAPDIHVLRDPTRGGLATTLNEIASQSKVGLMLDESLLPVNPAVRAACELLGFDPLYIANEGKVIIIVPSAQAESALEVLKNHPYGSMAAKIGEVNRDPAGRVLMRTLIGGTLVVDSLAGEILPRIC